MRDTKKTKAQLIEELRHVRQRIAELESLFEGAGESEETAAESRLREQDAALQESARSLESEIEKHRIALRLLRERNELLESIFSNIQLAIVYLDSEYNFIRVNQAYARALGHSPEFFAGKNYFDLLSEDEASVFQEVVRTGAPVYIFEKPLQPIEPIAAESEVYWDWSLQPVRNLDGKVNGLLLCLIDVTRRRQAQQELNRYAEELERSNRELEDFAYIASHDLQEPLRKIQTFGTRLLDLPPDSSVREAGDYIQRMVSASRRMQKLIDALLAYSRVTTAASPLKPVDLADVGKDAITNLEARIRERKANVFVQDLPSIEADPVQMLQLFQNLIGNALKFYRKEVETAIRISAEVLQLQEEETAEGDEPVCVIRVADNGIGFDERYLERIFEPLQRLHGRNEYDGVGMGLAICKKIVERHGGSLTAESTPGKGSTFIVRLPMRQRVDKIYGSNNG